MRKKLHRHDLSCEKNFSANLGLLIPTHWRRVYPGDIVRHRATDFIRLSPMLAPIMSKLLVKRESFYVAEDTIWTGSQEFHSRGQNGSSTKTIPHHQFDNDDGGQAGPGTLLNYFGFKPKVDLDTPFVNRPNALITRCYQSICNWHYFDQDYSLKAVIDTGDGPDTTTRRALNYRLWERDRFTTARLTPQRGDDVVMPGGTVDLAIDSGQPSYTDLPSVVPESAWGSTANIGLQVPPGGTDTNARNITPSGANSNELSLDLPHVHEFSGEAVVHPATMRELEERVAIQRFRTRLQSADGSYPDYCLATFGIRAPDIELQKPVLLATSTHPVQVSEVLQTAPDADDGTTEPLGVGELYGHGIATAGAHGYKYRVRKHGYVMTILSVVPKPMYMNAVDKEFFRRTADEFWDPDLDMIGEEVILKRELANTIPSNLQEEPFGYTYRNYTDRSAIDTTAGEFDTTLKYWHQARDFSGFTDVELDYSFLNCVPSDRIFALGSTQDHLRVKSIHDVKMLRVMSRLPARGIL